MWCSSRPRRTGGTLRPGSPRPCAVLSSPAACGEPAPEVHLALRLDGKLIEQHEPTGAFVATLVPGSRAAAPDNRAAAPDTRAAGPVTRAAAPDTRPAPADPPGPGPGHAGSPRHPVRPGGRRRARQPEDLDLEEVWIELGTEADAELVEIVDADPAVVDLAEAQRVVAGGAGLTGDGAFDRLAELGGWLRASVGATRVVTDAGLVSHERQIGTTGVSINPRCYVAFGISGAAQHVGGIGDPEHIVAANLDELSDDGDGGPGARDRRPRACGSPARPPRGRPCLSGSTPSSSSRPAVPERFDAVVVGAGPAGAAAALVLARARKSVCLLERGPFPGSKNLYGGVIYPGGWTVWCPTGAKRCRSSAG